MIKGNKNHLSSDNKGLINIKVEKKLRKMDLAKLRDREITIKQEFI
jgi:hypothetical protein